MENQIVRHLRLAISSHIKESQDCVAAIQTERMGSKILIPQWEDK